MIARISSSCRLRFVMREARDAAASVLEHRSLGEVLALTKGLPPRQKRKGGPRALAVDPVI